MILAILFLDLPQDVRNAGFVEYGKGPPRKKSPQITTRHL